jgi:Fic family protein
MFEELLKKIDFLHGALAPFRPFSRARLSLLKDYYRIGSTYSSNALEGNTLTESETKVVIEDGLTIGGKSLREHLEATGLAQAYDHIYGLLKSRITENDILELHRLFFQKIDPETAGRFRIQNVIITGTDYLPPDFQQVPDLIQRHLSRYNNKKFREHHLLRAADLHAEFESIHPFIDGNGRIGRLLLSLYTLKGGYGPVIFSPVRRGEYLSALRKANQNDLTGLRRLVLEAVYEELKALKRILEHVSQGNKQ